MPHFIFDHFKNTGFQADESTQTPPTSQEWHAWHAFSVGVVMKAPKSGQLRANGLWVFHQTDSVTSFKPSNSEIWLSTVCAVSGCTHHQEKAASPCYPGKQLSLDSEIIHTFGDMEGRGDQVKGLNPSKDQPIDRGENNSMEGQSQPPALGMQEALASNTCSSAVTKYLKTFILSTSHEQIQPLPKAKSLPSRP